MKFLILLFPLLLLLQPPAMDQHYSNSTWETLLGDVKMRYRFSVAYNGFVQVPRFGEKLQAMDGTELIIRGFFLPADVTGDAFVLSYVPMQMCFFCSGSGVESVVELHPLVSHRIRFQRFRTDDFIEVKGTLKLNANDPDHLMYILENVEFVKKYD